MKLPSVKVHDRKCSVVAALMKKLAYKQAKADRRRAARDVRPGRSRGTAPNRYESAPSHA